ncbi:MAG: prolipoprotein diacylglyceryl transferase family protein [Gemmataceae bacterium]
MWQVIYRIPLYTDYTPEGIPIYGFGLMLFLAFLLCTWLASKRAPTEGIHPDTIQDMAFWIVVSGLIGARTMSLLTRTPPVSTLTEFLVELPRIWDGGIVLYGSVLGGLVGFFTAYFLFYRRKGLNILRFLDTIAPAIALGLVLGRMGCFLNGCCYGMVACANCVSVTPVGFPLCAPAREVLVSNGSQTVAGFTCLPFASEAGAGVEIDLVDPQSAAARAGLQAGDRIVALNGKPVRTFEELSVGLALGPSSENWPRGRSLLELTVIPRGEHQEKTIRFTPYTLGLYPTQLYEVMSMFLLMLVLMAYYPLRRNPGQVMALLMIGYGLHRYLNELLRDDPRPKGVESYGSVILVVGGLLLWGWLQALPKAPPATPLSLEPKPSDSSSSDPSGQSSQQPAAPPTAAR